jgi:hypothetical protein
MNEGMTRLIYKHDQHLHTQLLSIGFDNSIVPRNYSLCNSTTMHLPSSLIALLLASAMAMPHVERDTDTIQSSAITNTDLLTGIDSSIANDLYAQEQKEWTASGGCKKDWDDDNGNICKNSCQAEADNGKCPIHKLVLHTIQSNGCHVWNGNKCRCTCYY